MWPFLSQIFKETTDQIAASAKELGGDATQELEKIRSKLAGDVTQAGIGAGIAAGAAIDPTHANTRVVDAILAQGWAPWLFLGAVVIIAALILRK